VTQHPKSPFLILNPKNTPIRDAVALMGSVHFTAEALSVTYDELQELIYDRKEASAEVREVAVSLITKTLSARI
jgi:hypothetical protein